VVNPGERDREGLSIRAGDVAAALQPIYPVFACGPEIIAEKTARPLLDPSPARVLYPSHQPAPDVVRAL